MKTKMVTFTLDTLPPLTEMQRIKLQELAALSDDQIEFSDMPELTDAQLAEMKPLPSGPSIDPDAHDTWLRAKVHEAVTDSRPATPHDQAMQKSRVLIINKRNA